MLALDTNILVRSALDDNGTLSAIARRMIERNDCYASLLAIGEMGFVLTSFYGVKLPAVVQTCRHLLRLSNVHCEHESRLTEALDGVAAGIDWFDALLWASTPPGVTLATFDKAFAKRAAALGWDVQVRLPKVSVANSR